MGRTCCYDKATVTRTTDRILVSEEQLAEAIRVVEEELARAGVRAEIEVLDYEGPELDEGPQTLVRAHLRTPMRTGAWMDLVEAVGSRLRAAGLSVADLPLQYDLSVDR
jgi:hypothetical protein